MIQYLSHISSRSCTSLVWTQMASFWTLNHPCIWQTLHAIWLLFLEMYSIQLHVDVRVKRLFNWSQIFIQPLTEMVRPAQWRILRPCGVICRLGGLRCSKEALFQMRVSKVSLNRGLSSRPYIRVPRSEPHQDRTRSLQCSILHVLIAKSKSQFTVQIYNVRRQWLTVVCVIRNTRSCAVPVLGESEIQNTHLTDAQHLITVTQRHQEHTYWYYTPIYVESLHINIWNLMLNMWMYK